MTVTNVVSAINEVTYAPTAVTSNTTSTRLGPYVLEGIQLPNKNANVVTFDCRVEADPEGASGGSLVEGAVQFYYYRYTAGNNFAHDVWALAAPDGTTMLRLQRNVNSGTHVIYWSDADGVESSATVSMAGDGLHKWDILWKIASDGTGYFTVKVDGSIIWSMTGQNNGRGSSVYAVQWRYESSIVNDCVVSAIIFSTTDTTDMRLTQQYPTGNGIVADWTGSYLDVDEAGASYTDSIYSSTSGQIEMMTYPAIPAGPASDTIVEGVFIRSVAYGSTGIKAEAYVASAYYELGVVCAPSTYQENTMFSQLTNPATAASWTVSDINASQFGYKAT